MNSLARRITTLHLRKPNLRPVTGHNAGVPGPSGFPSHAVQIHHGGAGILPLSPLITSDGAEIPATGPGAWDQLRAAGRTP